MPPLARSVWPLIQAPSAPARKDTAAAMSSGWPSRSSGAILAMPTATDLFLNGKTPETVERMAKMAPLERLGQPDDIAAAVSFLAGADGAWINGQTLRANGGIV